MRIPEVGTHWQDQAANKLTGCVFDCFVTKMQDIQEEFGGSPRKQTKEETLAEGLKAVHNATAAKAFVGQKFVVSKTGRNLFLSSLPYDDLLKLPLPQSYEDELTGGNAGGGSISAASPFASFGNKTSNNFGKSNANSTEEKRLGYATKIMFLSLAASMEVSYAHEDGDLVILEVVDKIEPMNVVSAVFEGGEHSEGADKFTISVGLLKEIN